MSDNFLLYIPIDPYWQPAPDKAAEAVWLLKSIAPRSDDVEASFEDEIRFYDPGQNWSGGERSGCGADAEQWWANAMDEASANRFNSLIIETPCCGSKVSLNDLRYIWPAAFGRFALEASNPSIADTAADQDQRISQCLGISMRKI